MSKPKFAVGDKVQSTVDPSKIGRIEAVGRVSQGRQYYQVFWGGPDAIRNVPEYSLKRYLSSRTPIDNLANHNLAGYADFQRVITYFRLLRDFPLRNNIYAFNASRTKLFPYQFKPLVKLLDSQRHRLLLCDEVGLGKTIEAGLILTELRARQNVDRVIVVCPSNLNQKWKEELRNRFDEEFQIVRSRAFSEYLDDYEEYGERMKRNLIVSLETLRVKALLERIQEIEPHFDLVIVDEAHHMRNFGTNQRSVGEALSRSSDAMIMLTATPVHLGDENLYSILNILDDEDFPNYDTARLRFEDNEPVVMAQICMSQLPPNLAAAREFMSKAAKSDWIKDDPLCTNICERIDALSRDDLEVNISRRLQLDVLRDLSELNLLGHIFTRTKRRDVHEDFARRHAHAVHVELSGEEEVFYDTVTALVRAESVEKGHDPLIQKWVMNTPQRRMASSIPAMVEYYRSNLGLDENDWSEDDDLRPEEINRALGNPSIQELRERLRRICLNWPTHGKDSKYDVFRSSLSQLRGHNPKSFKIIVFAFFKDTLRYLRRRLREDGFESALISGDVHPEERVKIIQSFRDDPDVEVLLSSRVGSEGLDFQFCDTLFNYDLPWNPMEVEQRIGRLDRIGQKSPVINIYNLWISNTIEERILERLYDRIEVFERTIGELEMILGDVIKELERGLFNRELTPAEKEEQAERAVHIIERKVREFRKLEKDAAQFIGTDSYFDEEIELIQNRRRYATGEQLKRFVEDFIRGKCPRTRFSYDQETKIGRLQPDDELQSFIAAATSSGELTRFLIARDRGIRLTFDSGVAFEDQSIEFITVIHPLIRAIVSSYDREILDRVNAQHVVLRSATIPNGFYYYFVYRLRIHAARPRNTFEFMLLSDEHLEAVDIDTAETVFGEMLEKGEQPHGLRLSLDPERARVAGTRAEETFLRHVAELKTEIERTNNAFVDRRLASLETFFQKKFEKIRERLDDEENPRIIKMKQSELRNRQSDLKRKQEELRSLREVVEEYDEIAAGILEVV